MSKLWIDVTSNDYTQTVEVSFFKEKAPLVNGLMSGQQVEVKGYLSGRLSTGNDGREYVNNGIKGASVSTPYQQQQYQQQYQQPYQQPQYQQTQYQQPYQQPQYQQPPVQQQRQQASPTFYPQQNTQQPAEPATKRKHKTQDPPPVQNVHNPTTQAPTQPGYMVNTGPAQQNPADDDLPF